MIQLGQIYKDGQGSSIEIRHYICGVMRDNADYRHIGIGRVEGSIGLYNDIGRCVSSNRSQDLVQSKIITIDGKDITISEESFDELKRQLTES